MSVPAVGNLISAFAIDACFGTLILVFGHNVAPKRLLSLFMVLAFVGNAGAAAILMFLRRMALFFPSSGQQILMVECGQGGGVGRGHAGRRRWCGPARHPRRRMFPEPRGTL